MDAEVISRKFGLESNFHEIPVTLLDPNPNQSRKSFDPQDLAALSASLTKQGMLQPIIVRAIADGRYQIVAGERRWRAAESAGWSSVPALVRHVSDVEAAEIALAENELRIQVGRMETARAAQALIDRYGHTHEELGAILGMDRTSVTNLLRLLTLESDVQGLVGDGPRQLSAGHAKVLIGLPPGRQRKLAKRVIDDGLSVRALERCALRPAPATPLPGSQQTTRHEPDICRLERQLADLLFQPVTIDWPSKQLLKGGTQVPEKGVEKGGSVKIRFHSMRELYAFLDRIRDPID